MIVYPKIPWYSKDTPNKACIAFEKYDGTNLCQHWDRENGFSYSTRRRTFDEKDEFLGHTIKLFEEYIPALEHLFQLPPFEESKNIALFAEYFGANSFAGIHSPKETQQIIFIDAWTDSLGFLKPAEFLKVLKGLPLPRIVYQGKLTGKFVDQVKLGKYKVFEGVVCKGDGWNCKIKTQAWLNKLDASFKNSKKWHAADEISRDVDEELEGR